jgi:hypothetical protein
VQRKPIFGGGFQSYRLLPFLLFYIVGIPVALGCTGILRTAAQRRIKNYQETHMPRYMIERVFPNGLNVPVNSDGAQALLGIVRTNSEQGVTWVHSYVSADKTRTFCIYDAPTPEAIREVARRNELPLSSITEVSVLAPYFYH